MTLTYTLSDIDDVATKLLKTFKYKTILFDADMGSGKTTMIKALAKAFGITEVIGSPTFSLVNDYEVNGKHIFHFDLYRIEDADELYDIGFEDYLNQDAMVFIEWPKLAKPFLEDPYHTLEMSLVNSNTRTLTLT